MRYKKRLNLNFFTTIVILTMFINSFNTLATTYDLKAYENKIDYTPKNTVDFYPPNEEGFGFLKNRIETSPLKMVVNYDGTFSICQDPENDKNYIYIHEYNNDKFCTKTLKIEGVFPKFGSFAKDNKGNYYIFYGLDMEIEDDYITKNMVLVKYDKNGNKVGECYFNEPPYDGLGVKKPIYYGCKMDISDNKLLIYFGCGTYRDDNNINHNSSCAALFDLNTLTNITKNMSIKNLFAKNSFDREIFSEPGGFVIIDRVASYPRAFKLSKFSDGILKSMDIFPFKGDILDDNTFSQLGGIIKTFDGYMIVGTYENEENSEDTPRNIFVQTISSDLSIKSDPFYLTNYSDKHIENAANSKIVQVESNKNILLWEVMDDAGIYKGTYIASVNDNGKIQDGVKRLKDCRLNIYDKPIYNSHLNKIYWAVNSNNSIIIYELDPGKGIVSNFNITDIDIKIE